MKIIEEKINRCLKNKKSFHDSYNRIEVVKNDFLEITVLYYYLWDNNIFYFYQSETQFVPQFNDCGWQTVTTKSRFNSISKYLFDFFENIKLFSGDKMHLYQEDNIWYLSFNDDEFLWDSLKDEEGWITLTPQYIYEKGVWKNERNLV
jgi:hypothetical protein